MKLLSKLTLLLGGLLTMTTLQACGAADPSVSNRTVEQHNLEKEFQPLFDFLAQEKKDFSDVKVYKSSIYTTDNQTGLERDYSVSFERLPQDKSGTYTITENTQATEYSVSIDDDGHLDYSNSVPEVFDESIFHLTLEKGFFQTLPISDYLAKHPETYLKNIRYRIDTELEYFGNIMKRYNMANSSKTKLFVSSGGVGEFDINIIIRDNNKSLYIQSIVKFDNIKE